MFRSFSGYAALAAAAFAMFAEHQACAHGFAGSRFFPATIQTDDPFVADEMSFPTVTLNPPGADGSRETDYGLDLAKRLTPKFGVTISDQWRVLRPGDGSPAVTGWDALKTGQQYQLFVDGPSESMALIGLGETWANTGHGGALGGPDFTTLSPTFDFGKGMGDLPNSLSWLRPFAITGNLSVDVPLKAESQGSPNPDVFNAGFAIEYSLIYLQSQVKNIGLGAPFNRMIPLVEITSSTPLDRGSGPVTGLIAPGVIWAGQYCQIGAEALVPYGQGQGSGIGGVIQLHFFLDDLFPDSIGRPLFGN